MTDGGVCSTTIAEAVTESGQSKHDWMDERDIALLEAPNQRMLVYK